MTIHDANNRLTGRTLLVADAYVVLRRHDEVLLQRRCHTGYRDGHWAVVAGHVDPGESVVEAALREAHEEAGITIDPHDLTPLTAMHLYWPGGKTIDQRISMFFIVTRWTGKARLTEPDKADSMGWYPLTALPEPLVPHEAHVLRALAAAEPLPAVIAWRGDTSG